MLNNNIELIEKCKEKYLNKYEYIIDKDNNNILIKCSFHDCYVNQDLNEHLNNAKCSKCKKKTKTIQDFKNEIIEKFGEKKFDLSQTKYKNAKTNVILRCIEHDCTFEQNPRSLLKSKNGGCDYCCSNKQKTTEQFIKEAREKYGDKYDYTDTKYTQALKKVKIKCKKHGIFDQTPANHLSGNGCPQCGNDRIGDKLRKTKEEFVEEAEKIHKDSRYDYDKFEYINSKTEGFIKCVDHGLFLQTPDSHLRGHGCPKCGNNRIGDKLRKTKEQFVEEAIQKHHNKFNYDKFEYKNNKTKGIIKCKKHDYDFEQSPESHLKTDHCCNQCYKEALKNGLICNNKYTKTELITKCNIIHQNKYDYSLISNYNSTKDKIIIICNIHGSFSQKAIYHLSGNGCPQCGNENMILKNRKSIDIFIDQANEIHNNRYKYNLETYIDTHTKIHIDCLDHGSFVQTPHSHLSGSGCPKCADLERSIRRLKYKTKEEFEEEAIQKYGDKYDYNNSIYKGCDSKMIINCKKHGEFKITPYHFLKRNQGCPKCSIIKRYSNVSINWLEFLAKYYNIHINHAENSNEYKIPNTKYKADGYCEELNTIFEFYGDYWHGNPNIYKPEELNPTSKCTFGALYEKTVEREKNLKLLGYNIYTIWESDWRRINYAITKIQIKFKKCIV